MNTQNRKAPPPLTNNQKIFVLGCGWIANELATANQLLSDMPSTDEMQPEQFRCDPDVRHLLQDRKHIKLMARQDKMAVFAANQAIHQAGLDTNTLEKHTGLYFTVGTVPFEQSPLNSLCDNSSDQGKFSMNRFANKAMPALNPLLTFKCLPNMPAYHVSYNMGIRGPYQINYPGPGQWFQSLQQAINDLQQHKIKVAIVGAVADQINPLVRHHVKRLNIDNNNQHLLIDSASILVLSAQDATTPLASLDEISIHYQSFNPLQAPPESFNTSRMLNADAGAVDPGLFIALTLEKKNQGQYSVVIKSTDRINASLRLSIP